MPNSQPKIAIFLASFRGQEYIYDQLLSIINQEYPHWTLYISDDSPDNHTIDIIKAFQNEYGADKIVIFRGPQSGLNQNFIFLLNHPEIQADIYAFADQDDVWYRDKLSRAVDKLRHIPQNIPALYCARTEIVDKNCNHSGFSPKFQRKPGFRNAIVQNIAGGNTMVINRAARRLICENLPPLSDIIAYDWWIYIAISAVNGYVYYDPVACLQYRQHGGNIVGANIGWWARLKRIRMLMQGRFRHWNDQNLVCIKYLEHSMPQENLKIMHKFQQLRHDHNPITRTLRALQFPIYRQTILGNIGLIIGALLGKI